MFFEGGSCSALLIRDSALQSAYMRVVCERECMCMWVRQCEWVCMWELERVYVYVNVSVCEYVECVCVYVCMFVCVWERERVWVYECVCVYACVCVYERERACVCVYFWLALTLTGGEGSKRGRRDSATSERLWVKVLFRSKLRFFHFPQILCHVIAVGGDLTTCGVEKFHQILEKKTW